AAATAAAEVSVDDGELPVRRETTCPALEPQLAVIVLRRAPLGAVGSGWLFDHAMRGPSGTERIDRAVQPVIESDRQEALLVFDVAVATVTGVEQFLLVCDAVAVGVGVLPDLLRMRFLGQERVGTEREQESWEHQVVDEDRVLVVLAVAVGIDVKRHATDGIVFAGCIS